MSSIYGTSAPIIFGDISLSDLTLVVDNQDFKIHKMTLACRSDVFKAMFYGDFKESKEDRVEIKEVSVKTFRRLLEIIYTGKINDRSFWEFPIVRNEHYLDTKCLYTKRGRIKSLPPSNKENFHNFWKDTTELLNIADRFSLKSMVEEYFESVIPPSIIYCKKKECHVCFNYTIFAILNGIDVSNCEKKYSSYFYSSWAYYADEKPFPEAIPVKAIGEIFKQLKD